VALGALAHLVAELAAEAALRARVGRKGEDEEPLAGELQHRPLLAPCGERDECERPAQ
jgi:hypothetical protein